MAKPYTPQDNHDPPEVQYIYISRYIWMMHAKVLYTNSYIDNSYFVCLVF